VVTFDPSKMLPLWGSWQRAALTEGDCRTLAPSTRALRAAVPLPQRGRTS
jgi:hypothetical protein